jgi:hypothetical protein
MLGRRNLVAFWWMLCHHGLTSLAGALALLYFYLAGIDS